MDFTKYLKTQFFNFLSKEDIHVIRAMIDEAYYAVNQLYNLETFLTDTDIGLKDLKAHTLRAAIASSAKTYCLRGILNFDFDIKKNFAKNSRHVELHRGNKRLYFARVDYPGNVPIKAQYRPNIMPVIQLDMLNSNNFIEPEINNFVATYGDGGESEFKFGNIGIVGEETWLYCLTLERGVYKYTTKSDKEELLVDLQEEVKKEIRKEDNNAEGEKK